MAIETKTGGEITSRSALIQELEAVKAEATAELEDANGDEKRAKEDTSRVDVIVASLRNCEIDTGTVEAIQALADTNAGRVRAAQARKSAQETRLAAVDKALAAIRSSAQGQFHTN